MAHNTYISGNLGIGSTSPAEVLEVDGTIKLSGESATYKITNVLDPTAAQDVATKAYVDAQGGGCYAKCADSGTAAGGATPSCPGGYSSVDTWSERSGFGQYQWGGMNSANYNTLVSLKHFSSGTTYNQVKANGANADYWPLGNSASAGAQDSHSSFYKVIDGNEFACGVGLASWNTGYGAGSGNTSYYNDCTACCAD